MNQYVGAYLNTDLSTASQERLLLMMYEGAVKFAHQAREKMVAGDKAGKAERLQRVAAIIDALNSALDREQGGEMAETLGKLYGYLNLKIARANLSNSTEDLDDVIKSLGILYEGWVEAVRQVMSERTETSRQKRELPEGATLRRSVAVAG